MEYLPLLLDIDNALKLLKHRDIVLDHYSGMSYTELGEEHGVDRTTIRRWINKDLDKLKNLLGGIEQYFQH